MKKNNKVKIWIKRKGSTDNRRNCRNTSKRKVLCLWNFVCCKKKISLWLKDEAEFLMMKRKKERKLNIKSNNKSPIKSLYYTKSNQNKSNRKRKVTNLKSEAEESSKPFVPDENIKCLIEQIQNIEVRYILSLFFGCIGNKRHSPKEIQKVFPSYSEEYILEIVDKFIENNSISNGINRTPKIKQISTM